MLNHCGFLEVFWLWSLTSRILTSNLSMECTQIHTHINKWQLIKHINEEFGSKINSQIWISTINSSLFLTLRWLGKEVVTQMIFGFPLQLETVWNRELEGKVREYEPTKAYDHLHIYEVQYGKKFVFPTLEWDHCTASPPWQVQHRFLHFLDQTFTCLSGLEVWEKESHFFYDFYFPNPPSVWLVCFYHCTSETVSAPQAGALIGHTYFYSFLPSQRREKTFFWCFYNQQLPINLSCIAIICRAKIFMHMGLVEC